MKGAERERESGDGKKTHIAQEVQKIIETVQKCTAERVTADDYLRNQDLHASAELFLNYPTQWVEPKYKPCFVCPAGACACNSAGGPYLARLEKLLIERRRVCTNNLLSGSFGFPDSMSTMRPSFPFKSEREG